MQRRLGHAALRLPHSQRTQTSDRSPLVPRSSIHNWRCCLAQSVGSAVHEGVPVDVADVARAAGPDEADRHDRPPLLVPVDELAPRQRLPVDQQPRTRALRSDPVSSSWVMNHSGNCQPVIPVVGAVGSSSAGGGVIRSHGRHAPRTCASFSTSRGSEDLVSALRPVVQAADDDRVVRQVEHRARAERRHDLALPDLALGLASPALIPSSSSISTLSIVLTQRLTLGSTSRIERFARNFMRRISGGSFFSSGLRNS